MYSIQRYSGDMFRKWDQVIQDSDVSHFMFQRQFMDYHQDRFDDHSLFIFKDDAIVGCFPANEKEDCLYSHQGLSFGGLILSKKYNRVNNIIRIFDEVFRYALEHGFKTIYYKCIPAIYHNRSACGDYYAMRQRAIRHETCDVSSTIFLQGDLGFNSLRKRKIKKAQNNHFDVELYSDAWEAYWQVLNERFRLRFDKKPVHNFAEIKMLKDRFPENIHLACVMDEQKSNVLGGVVIFLANKVVHAQYIAVNTEYEDLGPLDLLFFKLIKHYKNMGFRYFDFGISTEDGGSYLNAGLAAYKEGFGATSTLAQSLEIDVKRSLAYAKSL